MIMKKESIITVICILFVGAFAYFGLPMFAPRMENPTKELFWETSISESKELKVFGLVLNESNFEKAIETFGNRVNLTLYETDSGDQLEGYFRETQVGPFVGRMAFSLNGNAKAMAEVKASVEAEKAPMSRKNSYKVTTELAKLFMQDTVFSLAFIPTHVVLTPDDIKSRFGEPSEIFDERDERGKTSVQHYLYPEKGIDVSLSTEKRSVIQYISPRFFEEKVVAPLKNKN